MSKTRQYTIRYVPPSVDRALRERAKAEKKSLNQAALEALSRGAGVTEERAVHHDLDHIMGTWEEDPEFDKALAAQDVIERELWR